MKEGTTTSEFKVTLTLVIAVVLLTLAAMFTGNDITQLQGPFTAIGIGVGGYAVSRGMAKGKTDDK